MTEPFTIYTLALLVLSFFVYSFAGWVWEVAYSFAVHRRFINRGFLFGPVLPIYGAGALVALGVMWPISNIGLQFVAGCAAAAVIEYGTSWVMERMFHARWWDYSGKRFNLHGRICLEGILLFGVMMLAVVHVFQPLLYRVLGLADPSAAMLLASLLTAASCVDCAVTVVRMKSFAAKLDLLQERLSVLRYAVYVLARDARVTVADVADDVYNKVTEVAEDIGDDARAGLAIVADGVHDTRAALADTYDTLADDVRHVRDLASKSLGTWLEMLRGKVGESDLRELAAGMLNELPGFIPRPSKFERRTSSDPYFTPTRNNEAYEWFCEKVLDGQGEGAAKRDTERKA